MPLSYLIEVVQNPVFWDVVAGTLILVGGIVGISFIIATLASDKGPPRLG